MRPGPMRSFSAPRCAAARRRCSSSKPAAGPRSAQSRRGLRAREPETDFARGVRQFGYLLIRVMVVIVLFVLTVNLLLDRPVIESLLFAVALAVGLSPELLPAIISVTLSAGARAMGRRGVIVRRLDAIENLGSMDILCTDKTGTLTEGTIVLERGAGRGQSAIGRGPPARLPQRGVRDRDREPARRRDRGGGRERRADDARLRQDRRDPLRLHAPPADHRRGRRRQSDRQHLIVTKGAFSNVLDICSSFERDGVEVPLDAGVRAELEAVFKAKGAEGFRVLAVATRRVAAKPRL